VEFSSWAAGYQLPNITSAYLMNFTLSNPTYVGVLTAILPRRLGGLVLTLVRLLGEPLGRGMLGVVMGRLKALVDEVPKSFNPTIGGDLVGLPGGGVLVVEGVEVSLEAGGNSR
jgi:hypothetical protein